MHCVDALCEQEVTFWLSGENSTAMRTCFRARRFRRGNVDKLETFDGVAICRELNSAHI